MRRPLVVGTGLSPPLASRLLPLRWSRPAVGDQMAKQGGRGALPGWGVYTLIAGTTPRPGWITRETPHSIEACSAERGGTSACAATPLRESRLRKWPASGS
jgi:hypothetical protein